MDILDEKIKKQPNISETDHLNQILLEYTKELNPKQAEYLSDIIKKSHKHYKEI
jgi:hypothetical protein